jgi:uncharacterized protein YutE (UPF0331/DUF86 family)
MKAIDPTLLAERSKVIETHLARIAEVLPKDVALFVRGTDVADVVSLRLLCAIQVILDLSIFACIHFGVQAPASYEDAVARLEHGGHISAALADRLEKAANFRDAFIHAFDDLDAAAIYRAAKVLPDDLRRFISELGKRVGE